MPVGKSSRDKGARWERAIVNWLRTNGHPYAERRGIGFGSETGGDIIGIPGLVVEAKNQAKWSVPAWWRQLESEIAASPPGTIGALVIKRPGKPDPADALAVITLADFNELFKGGTS